MSNNTSTLMAGSCNSRSILCPCQEDTTVWCLSLCSHNVCPCLGRGKENDTEAGKELVEDGSGGDQQHGWSVKKNQRVRMEDATDATGNCFAVYDGHGGTEAVCFVKLAVVNLL